MDNFSTTSKEDYEDRSESINEAANAYAAAIAGETVSTADYNQIYPARTPTIRLESTKNIRNLQDKVTRNDSDASVTSGKTCPGSNGRRTVKGITKAGKPSSASDSSVKKLIYNNTVRHIVLPVRSHPVKDLDIKSLCEFHLGLVIGHLKGEKEAKNRIIVMGFVPGHTVIRSGILIGDWMMAINGLPVFFNNIEKILSKTSQDRKLTLTVQQAQVAIASTSKDGNAIGSDGTSVFRASQQAISGSGQGHQVIFGSGQGHQVISRSGVSGHGHQVISVSGQGHQVVSRSGQGEGYINTLSEEPIALLYLATDIKADDLTDKDTHEDIVYQYFPRRVAHDSVEVENAESSSQRMKHSNMSDLIQSLRGCFLTLSHLFIQFITGNKSSRIRNSTVTVNGTLYHIAYHQEQEAANRLLIVCCPANRMSTTELNKIIEDIVAALRLLYYEPLPRIFENAFYKESLDRIVSNLFLHQIVNQSSHIFSAPPVSTQPGNETQASTQTSQQAFSVQTSFIDSLSAVQALFLPEETKIVLNNCLSSFEAADFADMGEDYYGLPHKYCIIGSCLFYQGYLLASHLSAEHQSDVVLYLHCHGLLMLNYNLTCDWRNGTLDSAEPVTSWKEIYLIRSRVGDQFNSEDLNIANRRTFLVVVRRGDTSMVAALLESADNLTNLPDHLPDPFYIDQVKNTLVHLDTAGVFENCRIRLLGPPVPSLTRIECFMRASDKDKAARGLLPQLRVKFSPKPVRKATSLSRRSLSRRSPSPSATTSKLAGAANKPAHTGTSASLIGSSKSTKSYEKPSSDSSWFTAGLWDNALSDPSVAHLEPTDLFTSNQGSRHNLPSMFDLSLNEAGQQNNDISHGPLGSHVKLPTGCENTLFHYVHFDSANGILITPAHTELLAAAAPNAAPIAPPTATAAGPSLHAQVLQQFSAAALHIRNVLVKPKSSANCISSINHYTSAKDNDFDNDNDDEIEEFSVRFVCESVKREGDKSAKRSAAYWVTGRLIRENCSDGSISLKEFYVCYEDSSHQNSVEMAFKLMQGTLL